MKKNVWPVRLMMFLPLLFCFHACNRNFSLPAAPEVHPQVSQSQYINNAIGGSVTLSDGTGVQIPANAFNQSTTVSITQSFSAFGPVLGPGFKLLKNIYYFNAGGASFAGSVTMTLPYKLTDIPSGYTESNLVVIYYNGSSWEITPSSQDTGLKKFTVITNHFSPWGVGATLNNGTPTDTPSVTSTPTVTFTGTWFSPTFTETPTPSSPTPTPTNTDTDTDTPTITPTPSGTWYIPTVTPSNTATSTITFTPTASFTGTWYLPTLTFTNTIGSPTHTPTITNTPTDTPTMTPTPSGTWYTPTNTLTPTQTSTFTLTPTGP